MNFPYSSKVSLSNSSDKTLYIGDFNIHVDERDSIDNINFQDTIDGYNYHNLVTFPTHIRQTPSQPSIRQPTKSTGH